MAFVKRLTVSVTTDGAGVAVGYSSSVSGLVRAISYVPDGGAPLDTGADVTITGHVSGIPILTITNLGTATRTDHPRAATVSTADAPALYAAGGQAVCDLIPVAEEAIAIAVAQGGAAATGVFHLYVEGS